MFSYCQSSQQTALGPEGSAYYSNNKHTADNGHVVEVLGSMKAPITIYKPTTIPDIAELQLRGIFFLTKASTTLRDVQNPQDKSSTKGKQPSMRPTPKKLQVHKHGQSTSNYINNNVNAI